ncbi:MAG: glycosyltransferase [Alphaproteobacteria bacterium]|nr:glycosyltransferase [Alphaproteobacteria bacterium]
MNPTILATSDYYLPGQRGGGGVQAISNMVARMKGAWNITVLTGDRDLGDEAAYAQLNDKGKICGHENVCYFSSRNRWIRLLLFVRKADFAIQYHNSFFSPSFTFPLLLARRFSLIPRRPLIVAPRGEFSPGALRLKAIKKKAYIWFIKRFGLCNDALWHASTEAEAADVRQQMGPMARVIVAGDCLPLTASPAVPSRPEKVEGQLDVVFLSRLCQMKNLAFALSSLSQVTGQVRFDIYGPKEDLSYWRTCEEIIERLPDNIVVRYLGEVPHEDVINILGRHHLFFLPTLGENFGFVILEALLAGCPILLSDKTPWQHIEEQGAGWTLPLDEVEQFRAVLQRCIDMDKTTFQRHCDQARAFGLNYIEQDTSTRQTNVLLSAALPCRSGSPVPHRAEEKR